MHAAIVGPGQAPSDALKLREVGKPTAQDGEVLVRMCAARQPRRLAEYAAVPADVLAMKPANLSFDRAAAAPVGGVTGYLEQGHARGKVASQVDPD